ncbi:Mth938-like domain-containing protein [Cocleimonas sp. KMM 6892]|uniref:Mth938-like domain-containing protein n=1 Tax=unclassified Cocleimonas TaxID=2639732 RepID=UPI002DBCE972|nr:MULTISPECIES: Mth938-like domain-containing protein [unclassified Cocleimonas]MEB8433978.1 Mth938-like domain-containing protein [Cocleimonas sp. KMM 6892]MEC4716789.1 Mth938-like domain-containing protein [Cocleimonas sp. KMM 6895]MEC4746056.1 Mth938-like domain-containing protein [Cocleimonas sp. KMM 6896]
MKFAEDHNSARYKISAYDNNSVAINGEPYMRSLVLSPMELIADWAPQRYSDLTADHLEAFYRLNAEIIILGTGNTQIFPSADILRRLAEGKIGYEVMDTQAACRTFNILMAEGRNVVAGLFLD